MQPAAKFAKNISTLGEVCFRYEELYNWGDNVLVAKLAAADKASEKTIANMVEERAALSEFYPSRFGFGSGSGFTPHLSWIFWQQ